MLILVYLDGLQTVQKINFDFIGETQGTDALWFLKFDL